MEEKKQKNTSYNKDINQLTIYLNWNKHIFIILMFWGILSCLEEYKSPISNRLILGY